MFPLVVLGSLLQRIITKVLMLFCSFVNLSQILDCLQCCHHGFHNLINNLFFLQIYGAIQVLHNTVGVGVSDSPVSWFEFTHKSSL